MSQQGNSSNLNLLSFLDASSSKIKEKTLQSCNNLAISLRKVVSQVITEPMQNTSQPEQSIVVANPVSPFMRKASSNREDLSKFGGQFLRSIFSKNHQQFQLFKSKISGIRHVQSNREERQPTSGSQLSLLKVSEKQSQFIPQAEIVEPTERRILGGRSSTKSIKLTDNGSQEEQQFNLTAKSRSRIGRPNLSTFHNDSLTYSQTGDMSRTLQRRIMSPQKRSDTSEIIPHDLKYGPDSPKKRINSPPETILEAEDSTVGREQSKVHEKQDQHQKQESPEPHNTQQEPEIEEPPSESKLDLIKKEVEQITKKNKITEADLQFQPSIQQSIESELKIQAQTQTITKKPQEIMNNASQNWASSRSLSRHRIRLQKQVRKGYQPNRAQSVQSRTNTENSNNISSSRRISSNDNKKTNIFNTEIDNYKQRIELLQKAKSRKRLLQEQLINLNQEIQELRKAEEQNPKKNKIKQFIGISDDHEARVRAAQLVNRLNKERVKRQQDILRNFGQVDGNIIESINELTKLREERQKKLKEQKKLQIVQRMKEHERKKQEDQKLKQASNQFVHQIKQQHTQASIYEAPQRLRKPTQPLPQLTPQLSLKKQRLRKVRKLNYVSKKAVGDQYTTLLFKN